MNGSEETKTITIDGSIIFSYRDFINIIQKELDFPRDCEGIIDRYLDWMTDLQWTPYNRIVIRIVNSSRLANGYRTNEIVPDFNEHILPFWKDEYMHCIVNPTPKEVVLELE